MIPILTGAYTNPIDDITDKIGDKNWAIKKGEWLIAEYQQGRTVIANSRREQIRTARLYGQGMQPNEKYKDLLTPWNKTKTKRVSAMNISWDIFPIFTKFRNKILGMFDGQDYTPSASAIDENSYGLKEDFKVRSVLRAQQAEFLALFKAMSGAQGMEEGISSPTLDDANFWQDMGAFKLKWEVGMEKLLNWSQKLSNWERIKKMLLEDLIDCGFCVVKDFTDPHTQYAKGEYVDIEWWVGFESRRNDGYYLSAAGEFKWYTLAQLKDKGLSDDQLIEAGGRYASVNANNNYQAFDGRYNHDQHADYKVCVFEYEFESVDTKIYTVRRGVDGIERAYREPTGKGNAKMRKNRWYRASLIPGTKILIDFDYQRDVVYDEETPRCSYSYAKYGDRGITESCIATIDELQLIIYKLRHAEMKAKPSGISIEMTSLSGITLNKEKMQAIDMIRLYNRDGNIIYRIPRDKSGLPIQGIGNPLTELKGGIGPLLQELMQSLELRIEFLRQITGVNAIVDASTPNPNALVGTSEIAAASTNDVLKPLIGAYREVKKDWANNTAIRWQCIAMFNNSVKGFVQAIGAPAAEYVSAAKEIIDAKFGISFEMIISAETRNKIEQAALVSMQAQKQGMPGISMSDYFYILRELDAGNIKLAQAYLGYREKKQYEEQQKLQQQNMEMNGKNATELEAKKAEAALALIEAQTEAEIKIIRAKGEEDRKTKAMEQKQTTKAAS
jgi:hypothetical protein